MSRARHAWVVVSLVALGGVVGIAAPVRAQDAGGVAQARAEFEQGLGLLDQHRYDDAIPHFEHSLALRESPAARYNLALACRGAGHPVRAIESLRRLLGNPAESARGMLDDAARVLAELERVVVRVNVRVGATPVELSVDGAPVAPLAQQRLELDPGRHVFSARVEGRAAVQLTREFSDGSEATVDLDAARGTAAPAHLLVRASRTEARILLDGHDVGAGEYEADVPAGVHVVRVSADGYAPQETNVTLASGDRRQLEVPLAALHGGGPGVLGEWWFWTVVGVVVVGAAVAVGVAVLGTGTSPPVPGDNGGTIATLTAF